MKLSKLTKHDFQLLLDSLQRYRELLSRKGCNDLDLAMTQENIDFMNEFEQWNYRNSQDKTDMIVYKFDPNKTKFTVFDFTVVSLLEAKIKQEFLNDEV